MCFSADSKWLVELGTQGETSRTGRTSRVSGTVKMPLLNSWVLPKSFLMDGATYDSSYVRSENIWLQILCKWRQCSESLNRHWNSEMFAHSAADCFVRLFVVDLYIWWFICICEAICLLLRLVYSTLLPDFSHRSKCLKNILNAII